MSERALTFDDVLLVPAYNHQESRRTVTTRVTDKTGKLTLDLPIMSANMDTITEATMASYMKGKGGIGVVHRFCTVEQQLAFYRAEPHSFVSVGAAEADMDRVVALKDAGATYFCLDVAHAHAKYVGKALKRMREVLSRNNHCIMAGNVATYAGADYLVSSGADIVKVGIGGGSVCTTRIMTGFGIPMLTAIKNCSRISRSIVADGGIRTAGDVVKALAFGADFVMIGGMLAGTDPTPGEVFWHNGKQVKNYRGMASKEAHEDFLGPMASWRTAEGVSVNVPYNPNIEEIFSSLVGGIRSGLTYGGASTILELQRKMEYVEVTNAGRIESLPHKTL